jgi:purine-binding chemotaxis protein CheW
MTNKSASNSIELLTFRIAEQEYALDIMSVREIRGWTHATPLPHAPHYMKGVINLRGTVLPVMDLSTRLGLPKREQNDRNVIILFSPQNPKFVVSDDPEVV